VFTIVGNSIFGKMFREKSSSNAPLGSQEEIPIDDPNISSEVDTSTENHPPPEGTKPNLLGILTNNNMDDINSIISSLEGSPPQTRAGLKVALFLLQRLDLPRDERRRCNKQLVLCLEGGSATVWLIKTADPTTANQIILDMMFKGTCKERAMDALEDAIAYTRLCLLRLRRLLPEGTEGQQDGMPGAPLLWVRDLIHLLPCILQSLGNINMV
jgi:hypothetical protein